MNSQPSPPPVPTSADVARAAGVSRATVSYVLNGSSSGRVGEPTRQRVLAAARELGYVPNAAARSLRAGRSGIVLMDDPNIVWGPLFDEFITGLRKGLYELGYTAVVYGESVPQDPELVARRWAELRPTAVMFGAGLAITPDAVDLLKRSGTQAVIGWGAAQVPGAHWMRTDLTAVGAVATRHLLERGRRAIGVVVPTDTTLDYFSRPRYAGALAAAAAFTARAEEETQPTPGGLPRIERLDLDYTEEAAADLAARLPELGLDAIFTYNDEYAMLVAAALQDAGIRIPQDIALVGSDDLMLCRLLRPRLTSVRTGLPDGRRVAELIDRFVRCAPGAPPETVPFGEAWIVARESS